ncbi:MAG: GSU2403 family nucleotidyltransferase fold protein [Nitrospirota bacterium]
MMEKLPPETQTLYVELVERLLAVEARRTIGHAPGSFTAKTVKGETYYYFQYSEPGGATRQVYVGKRAPALERVVAKFESERDEYRTDRAHLQRLCAQLRAGGALVTDTASARILRALADSGVFRLGGVLIGTHAFAVLGNILGTRWTSADIKTQDVDVAAETTLAVALPEIAADIPKALDSLQMGFLPVPSLNPKNPSTSFKIRGKPLRVDIVTPQKRPTSQKPVLISRFNVAAQPLPFLDYLLEGAEAGAIVDGGGVLVQVPTPARFALHKLIVSGARQVSAHGKSLKDLHQAAQVLAVLAEERPGDVMLAWEAMERRGTAWTRRLRAGLSALQRKDPFAHEKVLEVLPALRERRPVA